MEIITWGDDEKPADTATAAEGAEPITFAEFLESLPPGQLLEVANLFSEKRTVHASIYFELQTPELQLHCTSEQCNGLRFFRFSEGDTTTTAGRKGEQAKRTYLTYVCSNCQKTKKVFSLHALVGGQAGKCYKFGEFRPYGPPSPARLIRLFGSEREIFLKGRRCQTQGLGIGAGQDTNQIERGVIRALGEGRRYELIIASDEP